ncbi:MAG: rhomboid family intramembrane serine protease [Deinococcus sp.]|uniref:rhomboid family intramembrane serine protease n=1 Tax=Deinococcus sp. TaxID=47478 RepID=UPI0026DD8755|nr:rhomboid family intramembrane serine protease [Deinococcus sp.]MDO4244636.1 rhomboid family intramembrane serine protease [Deinococcus sp.]
MSRPTRPSPSPIAPGKPQIRGAAGMTAALMAVMWGQEIADQFVFGQQLDSYGISPREAGTFWHIWTAPFLHADFAHLVANSVPLAVLAFMTAVRSVSRFVMATAIIALIGGGLVWLLGRGDSNHLGASELVFGYLAYLLGVGWWERTPVAIVIAVIAFALYGGILWGVLPSNPNVSWEAHLFGFIGGLVAAALLHRTARPARRPGSPFV